MLSFAKANPGKLNVGAITPGSTQHLSAKLFETMADVDMLVVPYMKYSSLNDLNCLVDVN